MQKYGSCRVRIVFRVNSNILTSLDNLDNFEIAPNFTKGTLASFFCDV